jgi:hypothetical protein
LQNQKDYQMARRVVVAAPSTQVDTSKALRAALRAVRKGDFVMRDKLAGRLLETVGVKGLLDVLVAAEVSHDDDFDSFDGLIHTCIARDPIGACEVAGESLTSNDTQTRVRGAKIVSMVAWLPDAPLVSLELLISAAGDFADAVAACAIEGLSCPLLPDSHDRIGILTLAVKNPTSRHHAMLALANLHDGTVLPQVVEGLMEDESSVWDALKPLGQTSGSYADKVLQLASAHPSLRIRDLAIEIGAERKTIRLALDALEHQEEAVRVAAAKSLWLSHRHDVVAALAARIVDPPLRVFALHALAKLDISAIRNAGISIYLNDGEVFVRRALSEPLRRIGDIQSLRQLAKDTDGIVAGNATSCLARLGRVPLDR